MANPHSTMSFDVSVILDRAAKWSKKLRPLDDFLAWDQFSVPEPSELQRRMSVNYIFIILAIVFLTLILMPKFFLLIIMLAVCWIALMRMPSHFAFNIGGKQILKKHLEWAMLGITAAILMYYGGWKLVMFFGICASMIGFHSAMRHVPKGHLDAESAGASDGPGLPMTMRTSSTTVHTDMDASPVV